jgi:uncharacterized protein YkwD
MKVVILSVFWGLIGGLGAVEVDLNHYREAALERINAARVEAEVEPLVLDPGITAMSQPWAEHLAKNEKMVHRSKDQLIEFVKTYHWRGLSENLHASPEAADPKKCIESWLKSPVHRRNLLNPQSRKAGLGVAWGADGMVYVVFNGAG